MLFQDGMHFKRREITIILEREKERERREKASSNNMTYIEWNLVLRDQIESIVETEKTRQSTSFLSLSFFERIEKV